MHKIFLARCLAGFNAFLQDHAKAPVPALSSDSNLCRRTGVFFFRQKLPSPMFLCSFGFFLSQEAEVTVPGRTLSSIPEGQKVPQGSSREVTASGKTNLKFQLPRNYRGAAADE